MNYAQIRKYDVANGFGIRTTLFVSGCHFHCPNCFNKEYQDFNYGKEFTTEEMQKFIDLGKDNGATGYSILGGEPLDQISDDTLLALCKGIKAQTGKSIWLWTGYTYEQLNARQKEITGFVDVLIDGQFVEALKAPNLQFKGSSNQRVIDLNKTRETGKLTIWEYPYKA